MELKIGLLVLKRNTSDCDQSGAIEMAELGFTYQQILNHYYKGTKIKKIEISSQ